VTHPPWIPTSVRGAGRGVGVSVGVPSPGAVVPAGVGVGVGVLTSPPVTVRSGAVTAPPAIVTTKRATPRRASVVPRAGAIVAGIPPHPEISFRIAGVGGDRDCPRHTVGCQPVPDVVESVGEIPVHRYTDRMRGWHDIERGGGLEGKIFIAAELLNI